MVRAYLLPLILVAPLLAAAGQPDPFVGTFVGTHWSGPFTLEVRRQGDGYEMRHSSLGTTSQPIRMTIDEAGDLYGTLMRDRYWIRRSDDGFRYRARGFDVAVERHRVSDGSALSDRWVRELSGMQLVQMSSSYDSSSGSRSRTEIRLCAGGRFAMDYQSSFRASAGGVSANSRSSDSATGVWRVFVQSGTPFLELRDSGGHVVQMIPSIQGGQFHLGDERTFVEPHGAC